MAFNPPAGQHLFTLASGALAVVLPSLTSSLQVVSHAAGRQARKVQKLQIVRMSSGRDLTEQWLGPNEVPADDRTVSGVQLYAVDKNGKQRYDVRIPVIGLGTYKFKKGSGEARSAVLDALSVGYRHIDTAFVYGGEKTEAEVGLGITNALMSKDYDLSRSDIFLTTKQWRAYHGYAR
mmetsp:Transcript_13752/g.40225  ORF Transcript_13752/g.40225 Transcript_13752/m.40225 type:complete len:178 (-) Transcript_13752:925-1458(-)